MKKLLLLCFVFLLSGNFYAQETAAQKKKAAQQTEKLAKAKADAKTAAVKEKEAKAADLESES
ncbi:hypothetical protein [Flavobacterium sp. PL12]|uniref:hypothetical protein n=1 Tax=Flavobacterium sp. PL12 TaxID=3071718 RepID=UPI00319D96E9